MMWLRVMIALEPGGLEEGRGFEFGGELPWVLGRMPPHAPSLEDPSISRRHAVISLTPRGFLIENVSGHNGMFIDGTEILPGQDALLPDETCHVQLGSVVFELKWLEETRPFTQALPPHAENEALAAAWSPTSPALRAVLPEPKEAPKPLFALTRDGDCCTVQCKGRLVALKPSCALALYALCTRPGQVVHSWDMLDEMGGEYDLAQAVSGLRREVRELIQVGWLARHELAALISRTSAHPSLDELMAMEDAALVRRLVLSRRGHGYALMVPEIEVDLSSEG